MARPGLPSFLSQAKHSFWLFFGGIWLFVGLVFLIASVAMALEERSWGDAVRTAGLVLVKEIVPADSDSSTEYHVRFRFTAADGSSVEGDDAVDVDVWERLTERGPIDVFYLPSSPSSARLHPGADLIGPVIFFLFGASFGGVGGFLFGRASLGLLRARRLLRSGIDAKATVTGVEGTNVSFNRRPQFRVRYTYRDLQGAEQGGDSGYLEWEEASSWKDGDQVAIRYDPRRPRDSVWVGAIETRSSVVDAPPPAGDAPPPA